MVIKMISLNTYQFINKQINKIVEQISKFMEHNLHKVNPNREIKKVGQKVKLRKQNSNNLNSFVKTS